MYYMVYINVVTIMKNLINYCATDYYELNLKKNALTLSDYLKSFHLDGIEQLIYDTKIRSHDYSTVSIGVHLAYWPYWLGFWLNNTVSIKKQFAAVYNKTDYFGGARNKNEWLKVIKANIAAALSQHPEYLVWHVADCSTQSAFTFNFEYNDAEVLMAAADIFNIIADSIPANVTVLFENLWWPGLRLLNKDLVKMFFDLIKRPNVGIMLDTGHLLNTNCDLQNQQQAVEYICRIITKLGSLASLIKGIHLSCSLSSKYQHSFNHQVPPHVNLRILLEHIVNIDQHRPFTNKAVRKVLDLLQPDYLVHELYYDDFPQLSELLSQQLSACGLSHQ